MLQMLDYNVEQETAMVSLVVGGGKEPVERTVSREALIILMDKIKSGGNIKGIREEDLMILKAIHKSGGVKWFDDQINAMHKF